MTDTSAAATAGRAKRRGEAGGGAGTQRVAAIDCGTNSIRLLIVDIQDRAAHDVVRKMEIVRLGEGVDRTGRLSPAAIERTRVVLARYADEIAGHGATRVRMVATSASRDASNAEEFREMVRSTLRAEPEVVTGEEEAGLSFIGAVRGLGSACRPPFLVVDIGGGSTEFVTGGRPAPDGHAVDAAISVDIGCVRMTERHLRSDPPTPDEVAAATTDVAAAVKRALDAVRPRDGFTLIGLAGSVTTVAAMALDLSAYDPGRIHHARVTYEQVAKITSDLLAATRTQRGQIPVMHPGRVDVIGAGALVLQTIMEKAGAHDVVASEHDILDGIAWSQVE